jgi:hypothetical protein
MPSMPIITNENRISVFMYYAKLALCLLTDSRVSHDDDFSMNGIQRFLARAYTRTYWPCST